MNITWNARIVWTVIVAAVLALGVSVAPASAAPIAPRPPIGHSLLGCWGVFTPADFNLVHLGKDRFEATSYTLKYRHGKLSDRVQYRVIRTWC